MTVDRTGAGRPLQTELVREDLKGDALPPGSIWRPANATPSAIVLVGHGGSQHRNGPFVEMVASTINTRIPAYVVAIDGPVHGDRCRGDQDKTRDAFVQLWRTLDGGVNGMVADWKAAIAGVRRLSGNAALPIGYYGVSMGTAYGIPLLAAEPSICVAALGMWSDAVAGMTRLVDLAPHVTCPLQFVHREADPFFDTPGARRLFDLLRSQQKTFLALPGGHEETSDQIAYAADYLAAHLAYLTVPTR